MDLHALLPILLSWAVHLSGYPAPSESPDIRYAPHSFFVQRVCGGKECAAVGWYNDRAIIYLDEKYQSGAGDFAASLLVHEITHYLQHQSGKFDSESCADSLTREREAYRVQNDYIIEAEVSFELIHPAPTSCSYLSVAETTGDAELREAQGPASANAQPGGAM